MTIVGITGHQDLPTAAVPSIRREARRVLARCAPPIIGVSSLAEGADQLVAREVLNAGGKLYVVIPCRQYRRAFESDSALLQFDELCSLASRVEILDFEEPSEEAYWGAGKSVVAEADQMLAIWDGRPSRGLGGTADVVEYAQRQNVHVDVIWPERTNR